MKIFIIFFILFFSISLPSFPQETEIQYLKIKDSTIINNARKFIEENKTVPELQFLKKGKGYLIIDYRDYFKGDTIGSYSIQESINPTFNASNTKSIRFFPIYYSFIDKRPVLIYLSSPRVVGELRLSEKSIKKIKDLIEPFLEPKQTIEISTGNDKKIIDSTYRPYYLSFYKEFRRFYVMRNSTQKKIVP